MGPPPNLEINLENFWKVFFLKFTKMFEKVFWIFFQKFSGAKKIFRSIGPRESLELEILSILAKFWSIFGYFCRFSVFFRCFWSIFPHFRWFSFIFSSFWLKFGVFRRFFIIFRCFRSIFSCFRGFSVIFRCFRVMLGHFHSISIIFRAKIGSGKKYPPISPFNPLPPPP